MGIPGPTADHNPTLEPLSCNVTPKKLLELNREAAKKGLPPFPSLIAFIQFRHRMMERAWKSKPRVNKDLVRKMTGEARYEDALPLLVGTYMLVRFGMDAS